MYLWLGLESFFVYDIRAGWLVKKLKTKKKKHGKKKANHNSKAKPLARCIIPHSFFLGWSAVITLSTFICISNYALARLFLPHELKMKS